MGLQNFFSGIEPHICYCSCQWAQLPLKLSFYRTFLLCVIWVGIFLWELLEIPRNSIFYISGLHFHTKWTVLAGPHLQHCHKLKIPIHPKMIFFSHDMGQVAFDWQISHSVNWQRFAGYFSGTRSIDWAWLPPGNSVLTSSSTGACGLHFYHEAGINTIASNVCFVLLSLFPTLWEFWSLLVYLELEREINACAQSSTLTQKL